MSNYFRRVPDFDYVNRNKDSQRISDYQTVKNLFKRGKIREDIFNNLQFFEKYKIIGDDRPDNVARKVYDDETLDWVVLLSNNILNIQTEWPLTQDSFENYLFEKYGSFQNINATKHYETVEVKNSNGIVIIPEGLIVDSDFSTSYFDGGLERKVTVSNITREVTNYQYEQKLEDDKRNIFLLKPRYLTVVFRDLESIFKYKKGGAQYVSDTLKRGENIRLFH
jgi:hypothetical protein